MFGGLRECDQVTLIHSMPKKLVLYRVAILQKTLVLVRRALSEMETPARHIHIAATPEYAAGRAIVLKADDTPR